MRIFRTLIMAGMIAVLFAGSALAQDQDVFDARSLGEGMVSIQHYNAYHNCCSIIANVVTVDGFNIYVTDTEPLHGQCWCICYFDVEAVLSDLPAGNYSIEYTYDADEHPSSEEWLTENLSITVPEWGTAPEDPSFVSSTSDCHDAPVVSTDISDWDHIKAFYR